jgi:hypothetical protein
MLQLKLTDITEPNKNRLALTSGIDHILDMVIMLTEHNTHGLITDEEYLRDRKEYINDIIKLVGSTT